MTRRRAFLMGGAMLAAGLTIGGACGYAVGVNRGGTSIDEPEELKSTGDADLDELRRLAVKAPIDELVSQGLLYMDLIRDTYPKDRVLWRGAERLCDAIISDNSIQNRNTLARWITQVAENADPALSAGVRKRISELNKVR